MTSHILIIDDSPSIRVFLKIVLRANGYNVSEAKNAATGIKSFKEDPPDLVILDLGMPDQDGLDVLPQLKAIRTETPVIILTVRTESEYSENAFRNGASDYITKPFQTDDLLEVISRLLQKTSENA